MSEREEVEQRGDGLVTCGRFCTFGCFRLCTVAIPRQRKIIESMRVHSIVRCIGERSNHAATLAQKRRPLVGLHIISSSTNRFALQRYRTSRVLTPTWPSKWTATRGSMLLKWDHYSL